METTNYLLTTFYVVAMDLIIALTLIWQLRVAKASAKLVSTVGITLFVWIALLFFGTQGRWLFPTGLSGITFFILVLAAIGLLGTVVLLSPLRKIYLSLSQEYLLMAHGVRVFVAAGFFTEACLQIIPQGFGLMDGFMHATSGFLALSAAIAYLKNFPTAKMSIWLANIVGILDLVIIAASISFVVFADLGLHHNMMIALFFAGPIFMWLHLFSIWKLLKRGAKPTT